MWDPPGAFLGQGAHACASLSVCMAVRETLTAAMCFSAASMTKFLQRKPRRAGESPYTAPSDGNRTKLSGQQHLCTGSPCLTQLFSLKLSSKMGPEELPQDKLQLRSYPGPFLFSEMLHCPGRKKITPSGVQTPQGRGCRTDPCFCFGFGPRQGDSEQRTDSGLRKGPATATAPSRQTPLVCTRRSKPKAKTCGYQGPPNSSTKFSAIERNRGCLMPRERKKG